MKQLDDTQAEEYIFARQPIVDTQCSTVGYELLYRQNKGADSASIHHPVIATAEVLVSGLLEKGDMTLETGKYLFLNISEQALDWVEDWVVPKDQVVLELLEDIPATSRNLAKVTELKRRGYLIALDDFVPGNNTKAFLPLADIVKVDVLGLSQTALDQVVSEVKRFPVTLLAEKVESDEQFRHCMSLGFEWFQGYFFAVPQNIEGKTFSSSEMKLISLVNLLCDPAVEINQLEDIVKSDPWLHYRLMRYVSGLCLKKDTEISSVRQAILMAGLVKLKAFILLMTVTRMTACSDAVVTRVFTVAAMSEFMANDQDGMEGDKGFLVGTFLAISIVLSCSANQLIAELKLTEDIKQLFFKEDSDFSCLNTDRTYLDMAKCAEQYSRQGCSACGTCHMSDVSVQKYYEGAVNWSDRLICSLSEEQ